MSTRQRFRALLEADGTNLKWVIARVPFAPEEVWKTRRGKRVKGTINGFGFRSSLFGSKAKGYCVLVNKAMQKGAQVYAGGMAEFVLEPDLEERKDTVPPELARLLKQSPDVQEHGVEFIGHSLGGGLAAKAGLEACGPALSSAPRARNSA